MTLCSQSVEELHVAVQPGGCLDCVASADAEVMKKQFAMALGISTLLEGRLVLISDWLPGLNWRIQVSQQVADLLPKLTVDDLWLNIAPFLARWLERPADADVFVLAPEWGECALVPSTYRWDIEPAAFTLRCRWTQALEQRF